MSYSPVQKSGLSTSRSSDMASPSSSPTSQKHRKAASTGGGRAWSEAEEAFLIETRERKMPYKHIAAQLKKTELACRLHYHQLSFGSKSRHHNNNHQNRNPESSHHSRSHTTSALPHLRTAHNDLPPLQQRPLPSFSPPASPPDKPILPRPHPNFSRAHTTSPLQHHQLRLQTSDLTPRSQSIDVARLNSIYNTHRLHFWSVIAADYGGNLSPATLEDAWRRGWQGAGGSHFPPTPKGSPLSSRGESREREPSIFATSFSAVTETNKFGGPGGLGAPWGERAPKSAFVGRRGSMGFARAETQQRGITPSSRGGFSVGSLLTEDKEVRSPAASSERSNGDAVMLEAEKLEKDGDGATRSDEGTRSPVELATVPENA